MGRKARGRLVVGALVGLIALPFPAVLAPPTLANHDGDPIHDTFQRGDVFVAVSDGKVQWRQPDGTLNKTLDTGDGPSCAG